jgi:hypothetical protein
MTVTGKKKTELKSPESYYNIIQPFYNLSDRGASQTAQESSRVPRKTRNSSVGLSAFSFFLKVI